MEELFLKFEPSSSSSGNLNDNKEIMKLIKKFKDNLPSPI